jgi:hypothetical protein
MVEFSTIDINNGTSSNWTSQWSDLRKTWWVEEDELKTLSGLLVVEGKFKENTG